ncbi:hypothetical protein [Cellulomonas sp.]|uniref:hypothetical protein n=1 Tax=Cellulomonas sp. TaxID=40001 RepID=UPI00258DC90C|nr:hypothetical protein [Cellulomonas sp.]MCR6688595.1 hypothetical protein [Cellulomonas sp.]
MSHTARRPGAVRRTARALLVAGCTVVVGVAPASATLLADDPAPATRTAAPATDDDPWATPHDHGTGGHDAPAEPHHDDMPAMDHDDMPGMDHGDMPGMDHGVEPGTDHGPAHGDHDETAPTHPAGGHAAPDEAPARPRGLVLGGFGLLNGAVLGAAAVLRRRTRARVRPRATTTRSRTTD